MSKLRHGLLIVGALAGLVSGSISGLTQAPDDAAEEQPSADRLIERLRRATEDLRAGPQSGTEVATEQALPAAALSPAQVKQRIGAELGVEVLDVRPTELDGKPVYAVKVMNPPGDANSALMVGTLVIDGDNGAVLGRAQAFPTFSEGAPLVRNPKVDRGPEIRRRTHR